jgi:effector-binding domain-containing protein
MSEHEPQLQQRPAQPYLAIAAHVTTEAEFRNAADRGFPELFGWLAEHGVEPAGPLFIRYVELDDAGDPLEIELGVPVAPEVRGDGRVKADALPAGRWATYVHVGPYNHATVPDLAAGRATLRAWADAQGLARLGYIEHFVKGPVEESDYTRWETELAYLTTA